ncbi:MAG: hypothetical protein LBE91_15100 [Tannerella sp.]|jgi:hypothetical protein|nr:hypothetical protein [Tannerella sp.]
MRAIEFKSKIKDNKILIPRSVRQELAAEQDKNVRIVVFVKDSDVYDEKAYRQMTKSQFLKGYADSDSIYDSQKTIHTGH